MKKSLILIISILMVALLLVSCAKTQESKPVDTTTGTTTTGTTGTTSETGGSLGTTTNSGFDESKAVTDKNGCYDSEGGKFYEKLGYIIDAKKIKYVDNCTTNKVLKEYSCGTIGYKDEESYTCPNGCSNGACIKSAVATQECTDTDFKDYFKKGTVSYKGSSSTDYCKDTNNVIEYTCTTVGIKAEEQKYCSGGCVDGACVNIEATQTESCSDSDAGAGQEFTKGIVKDPKGTIEDSCLNSYTVKEWKCSSVGFRTSTNVECKNGCLDGACKQ